MTRLNLKRFFQKTGIMSVILMIVSTVSVFGGDDNVLPTVGMLTLNKKFTLKNLGSPLKIMKLSAVSAFKHPKTGDLHLFMEYLANTGLGSGPRHPIVDLNLKTGQYKILKSTSNGVDPKHIVHYNGKIYISDHKPARLHEYDPVTGKTRIIGHFRRSGGGAYKIICLKNGKIYFGHILGYVSVYDTVNDKLIDYGYATGKPEYYGIIGMEVEEPYVYCTVISKGEHTLAILDTRTKKYHLFFRNTKIGALFRDKNGVIVYECDITGKKELYALDARPYPYKSNENLSSLPSLDEFENKEYDYQKWNLYTYGHPTDYRAKSENKLQMNFDFSKGNVSSLTGSKSIIKFKKISEKEWKTVTISGIPTVPVSIACLAPDVDGNLIGASKFYGPIFKFDTNLCETNILGPSPLNVYAMHVTEKYILFGGYPSSVKVYKRNFPYSDPRNPATIKKSGNGWLVFHGPGKWSDFILTGKNKKVYIFGRNGRHHNGGGLLVYNPENDKAELLRKPFELHAYRSACFISNGEQIAVSARPLIINGKKTAKPLIMLYDMNKNKIIDSFTLGFKEKVNNYGRIISDNNKIIAGIIVYSKKDRNGKTLPGAIIYTANTETKKLLSERFMTGKFFTGFSKYDHPGMTVGPDGCGWFFLNDSLVRFYIDGSIETVRKNMPFKGSIIFQGKVMYIYPNSRVWFGESGFLYRIKDIFQ